MFPSGNTDIIGGRFVPLAAHVKVVPAQAIQRHDDLLSVDIDVTSFSSEDFMAAHGVDPDAAWSYVQFSVN